MTPAGGLRGFGRTLSPAGAGRFVGGGGSRPRGMGAAPVRISGAAGAVAASPWRGGGVVVATRRVAVYISVSHGAPAPTHRPQVDMPTILAEPPTPRAAPRSRRVPVP